MNTTRAVVAATGAALVLTMAAAPVGATPSRAEQGSAGIGDPYFPRAGNGGYDVITYHLDLKYTPPAPAPALLEGHLRGVATVMLRAKTDLRRFNLDLRGLDVKRVRVNGERTAFVQTEDELTIKPRPRLRKHLVYRVKVRYAGTTGRPTDVEGAYYGWHTTRDGAMVANEPDGAPTWFPSNDHPRDKAAFSFDITVPRGLVAVANGTLVGRQKSEGWTTWQWQGGEQMATYLATASVGNYELRRYAGPGGLPIIDAVDKDLPAEADDGLTEQRKMIRFFAERFGPYPFGSFGAIVDDDDLDYALETQTRPIYSQDTDPDTVAHELAHQWFGNSVSPRAWRHIWLNEGWASYASWLWAQHDGGSTVQEQFDDVMSNDDPDFWSVKVVDPGANDLFADAVYDRGAATLHALRGEIGSKAFFRLARRWESTYAGSVASTGDFQRLAEKVSGKKLDRFFDVWVRTPEKPAEW